MRNKEFEPEEVVESAMQLFWERGYNATSVQDLVERTGLSRSSLYGTFENKQFLYKQALCRYETITKANARSLAGPGTVSDLVRQLLMEIVNDELTDQRQRGCLVANATLELAGHDKAVAELVRHNFQILQEAFTRLIIRGQQSGEIAPEKNPRALARFLINTMQGMRVLSKGSNLSQRRQCLMDVIDVALGTL